MSWFNIRFVGDAHVGKTTFIERHRTGEFKSTYFPTKTLGVSNLRFNTNRGLVTLCCFDSAPDDSDDWKSADAFIVFFDVTSTVTYENTVKWIEKIQLFDPERPIVLCGNKVDKRARVVMPEDIDLHQVYRIPYYDVSAKSNYNFEKPFLKLLRNLMQVDVHFVESADVAIPPQVSPPEPPSVWKNDHAILPITKTVHGNFVVLKNLVIDRETMTVIGRENINGKVVPLSSADEAICKMIGIST